MERALFVDIPALEMGDRGAWRKLYWYIIPHLYKWCLGAGMTHSDADDVVSEAVARFFVELIQDASEIRDPGSRFAKWPSDTHVKAWLFLVARNLRIDMYRRRKPLVQLCPEAEGTYDPSDRVHDPKQDELVRYAIAGLDEDDRRIILDRDLKGLRFDEIRKALKSEGQETNEGALRMRYHRAMKRLRDLVGVKKQEARHE